MQYGVTLLLLQTIDTMCIIQTVYTRLLYSQYQIAPTTEAE